jgi:hypothetical protein
MSVVVDLGMGTAGVDMRAFRVTLRWRFSEVSWTVAGRWTSD